MNITLTGFMGTGKTAVGKRLAKRLDWRFVDIDALIEAGACMPIAKIFAERGEQVFRRLERRHISRIIRGDRQVIATGGGAFIDAQNRARLRVSGPVICLTARPQTILNRVKGKIALRPLLAGSANPLVRVRTLLHERQRAYAQADLTVDTTALSVEDVVDRLWEKLSPCLCKSWQYLLAHSKELAQRYGGKYIVVVENRIIASGETQLKAYHNACLPRPTGKVDDARRRQAPTHLTNKQDAGIYYIPLPEESLTAF